MQLPDNTGCELSVVIPTYNEAENIRLLVERLVTTLAGINYEVIVVDDDSPDLTWQVVEGLANGNPRISVLRRRSAKGLSSAVTAGLLEARGRCLAVMDADLQHDEAILPAMYREVIESGMDVCVGSREAEGGSYGSWSRRRRIVSSGARWLADKMVGKTVQDPMSGYFAISREYFEATIDRVNPQGFKILLEFIARGDDPSISEVGYTFRNRVHGETKLNASVAIEYVLALIDLRFGWLVPSQFVKFGLVGVTGSLVNFGGFAVAQQLGMGIPVAVVVGVEIAILWTYVANNFFTFTPNTFRGRNFVVGLGLYQLVCCYGLVVQLSVLSLLLTNFPFLQDSLFTLYPTYLVGVLFAAVGNYFLHSYYTWNRLGFQLAHPSKTVVSTPPG
ncbi:MAG: glycosyltransferase [Granulosicoccus sp.]